MFELIIYWLHEVFLTRLMLSDFGRINAFVGLGLLTFTGPETNTINFTGGLRSFTVPVKTLVTLILHPHEYSIEV